MKDIIKRKHKWDFHLIIIDFFFEIYFYLLMRPTDAKCFPKDMNHSRKLYFWIMLVETELLHSEFYRTPSRNKLEINIDSIFPNIQLSD